jgi:hypothetical protein
MKFCMTIVLSALVSTNCWALFGRASEGDKKDLLAAIKTDDGARVAELLKSAYKDEQYGDLTDGFGHYLLGAATYSESDRPRSSTDHHFTCSPKSVKSILDAGAKASEAKNVFRTFLKHGHLSGAIISYCPESVANLLTNISQDEALRASSVFEIHDQFANDEKLAPRIIETAKTLKNYLEPKCKSGEAPSCHALESVLSKVKAFAAREQEAAFLKTPKGKIAGLRADACHAIRKIQQNQDYISHQRKIGQTVGVMNAKILYESANRQEVYKKEFEEAQLLIKKNGGEPIKNVVTECAQ